MRRAYAVAALVLTARVSVGVVVTRLRKSIWGSGRWLLPNCGGVLRLAYAVGVATSVGRLQGVSIDQIKLTIEHQALRKASWVW
jgi:hypothetical protein